MTGRITSVKMPRFEVFKGTSATLCPDPERWYWRLVAPNGRVVCIGGEPFTRADSAVSACRRVARMLGAPTPRVRVVRWGASRWGAS